MRPAKPWSCRMHLAEWRSSPVSSLVSCRFRVPWASSDLCPFNTGPHWLGGYNEVSTGVVPHQVHLAW